MAYGRVMSYTPLPLPYVSYDTEQFHADYKVQSVCYSTMWFH